MKETLYDKDEYKLIERITQFRETHSDLKVGEIQRPLILGGVADDVFKVEIEYE